MGSQHRCGLQRVLPHLKTRVRQFITDRRGAAAMFLGLGILPAMALGTGAVLVNREFMNLSAMQSAVDTSSIALAKNSIHRGGLLSDHCCGAAVD